MAFPDPSSLSRSDVETGTVLAPKFDQNGLVPAIAVDSGNGQVLMMAYMNAEALEKTLSTGEAHYWSRSRGELWHKGATSGQVQIVQDVRIDCDQDTVLLSVRPQGDGGCCHVGFRTCFFRRVDDDGRLVTDQTAL